MVGGISWARADGAGQPQQLTAHNAFQYPTSFTPISKRLAFVQIDGIPQLWSVDVEERGGQLQAGTPVQWLTTRFTDSNAVFSPTGEWVAYDSNESGRTDVYVRPFSAPCRCGRRRALTSSIRAAGES
jgi:Tol biopolymer transport system component